MMLRVPRAAPSLPPETGASSQCAPLAATASARVRVARGEMVEWSMTSDPGASPARTPPGPSTTCSTSGVSETQTITRSQAAARSAGPAAEVAPAATRAATRSGERFHTVTAWPLARRLRAMPPPMVPRPM